MVRTQREIALRASRVHSQNARKRRWQRAVAEMRANGLDVLVFPAGKREEHPDYTLYATNATRV